MNSGFIWVIPVLGITQMMLMLISGAAGQCRAAVCRSVDRIAAGYDFSGEGDDEVTGPAGWFVDGVGGAGELSATGHHGVANGGVVDAGFLCVSVGAGPDEVAFADEGGDVGRRTTVAFD